MMYKIRWYLENSLAIIYWSATLISFFLCLIFILEKAEFHWKSFFFLFVCLYLVYRSRQKKLLLTKTGVELTYVRFWKREFFAYDEIQAIQVLENSIHIIQQEQTRELKIKPQTREAFLEHAQMLVPAELLQEEKQTES